MAKELREYLLSALPSCLRKYVRIGIEEKKAASLITVTVEVNDEVEVMGMQRLRRSLHGQGFLIILSRWPRLPGRWPGR